LEVVVAKPADLFRPSVVGLAVHAAKMSTDTVKFSKVRIFSFLPHFIDQKKFVARPPFY
jgi:hypothetical protein